GLEKGLINPYTKDKIVKDRIVYLYNKAVIEESIPKPTPEALKTFYEDHRDSIFYQLKKINLYARIYSDSIKAAEDINEIKKGTPFEKVSNTWFVKTYIRERDGSLNSYRSQEPPYLAKAGFKLGLNEAAGPVEYYDSTKGKQFAVIKCIRIRPEKQLTYDDVKGKRIVEEFRNFYRQKISDDLVVKLRQKYGVKIFEDELSKAIESK
ncbi:MAG: peptidylprolyl isomerase, partial [Ignavibacteriaceae bacterium]